MKSRGKLAAASFFLVLVGVIAWIITPCRAEEKAVTGPLQVGKRDLCPVCGMFAHKYPNWLAQVVFSDGTCASFDGPKDMFKYIFDLRKYNPKKSLGEIAGLWVTDYYTTKWIDGKEARYVIGSDVLGPMGHELVPHSSDRAARSFSKDHAGARILKFDEVDLNLIESLR
jgi:copper chaperone NosL